ncbi:MAG: sugar kinase [Pyrinomonadaceae bacterium MAG19_C2-C3]|nr:sugar kinase [Pyrinomonadaceae bacterium MAG19_C2-C3]
MDKVTTSATTLDGLSLRPKSACRWDLVSLGEVMLRFDPEDERIHTTRTFRVWEGGGEYNVARALQRCFHQQTAIVTALVDNSIGRLIEDLMRQGGVDLSHVKWVAHDGIGESARNGLYFLERGFGVRSALACYDRGHTTVSQLRAGDVDWEHILLHEGARWFHTGGIFAGLSETTTEVAREAMQAAHTAGAVVSYDANYRALLWERRGGRTEARRINRELAQYADVVFGSEDDFLHPADAMPDDAHASEIMQFQSLSQALPNIRVTATTHRQVRSANVNEWGARLYANGEVYRSVTRELEIYDRVGGGDAFAAGVIYGLLEERGAQWAIECGAAHGALAQTTPGDSSMATLQDVERVMRGEEARAVR